jgi:hypothetical protein
MLFVITAIDKEGSLQLRMATREAHIAYIKETGVVKLGGPFLNAQSEMMGSMILIDVPDLAAARHWQTNDPYAKAGLFQSSELRSWKVATNTCEAKL